MFLSSLHVYPSTCYIVKPVKIYFTTARRPCTLHRPPDFGYSLNIHTTYVRIGRTASALRASLLTTSRQMNPWQYHPAIPFGLSPRRTDATPPPPSATPAAFLYPSGTRKTFSKWAAFGLTWIEPACMRLGTTSSSSTRKGLKMPTKV